MAKAKSQSSQIDSRVMSSESRVMSSESRQSEQRPSSIVQISVHRVHRCHRRPLSLGRDKNTHRGRVGEEGFGNREKRARLR